MKITLPKRKVVCHDMNGILLEEADAIICIINNHKYKSYVCELMSNNNIRVAGEYSGIIDASSTYFCP